MYESRPSGSQLPQGPSFGPSVYGLVVELEPLGLIATSWLTWMICGRVIVVRNRYRWDVVNPITVWSLIHRAGGDGTTVAVVHVLLRLAGPTIFHQGLPKILRDFSLYTHGIPWPISNSRPL